jgi:CheY-like chemotaxis protein
MTKKILVVDDEPDFVRIILAKLKSNGYEAISATNGKEAITEAQLQKPDLIVMDIVMPDMHGTDAVRLLQTDGRTENIPIIFISGAMVNLPENEDTRQATINGKPYMAIAKPFKAEKLISEINKFFNAAP